MTLPGPQSGESASAALLAIDAWKAARAGAGEAMSWWARRAEITVEEKAASDDLVSQADRETERVIRLTLERLRPDDAVKGEEGSDTAGTSGVIWVIDPIDGTTDFIYGRTDWAVSIAAIREADGQVLAACVAEPPLNLMTCAWLGGGTYFRGAPAAVSAGSDLERALVEVNLGRPEQRHLAGRMVDALVTHVRDVRRGGSAACGLAKVATGRAEAYWGPGLRDWDGAAGMLLVAEAGGAVGDLGGSTKAVWPETGDILASTPALHGSLRQILSGVYEAAPAREPGESRKLSPA